MEKNSLRFVFTHTGLYAEYSQEQASQADILWKNRFDENSYEALYHYGMENIEAGTATAVFVKKIVKVYLEQLTRMPELEMLREKASISLSEEEKDKLLLAVPFAVGSEYITQWWLEHIFEQLNQIFQMEMKSYEGTVALYLEEKNQTLRVPERVFFHLVENKNADYPFAFMATYASKKEDGKVAHMPLKYALTEYKQDRDKLLKLLSCLNKAAEVSDLIAGFMESGEMFYPLQLTAEEAYEFLKQIEAIESAITKCYSTECCCYTKQWISFVYKVNHCS